MDKFKNILLFNSVSNIDKIPTTTTPVKSSLGYIRMPMDPYYNYDHANNKVTISFDGIDLKSYKPNNGEGIPLILFIGHCCTHPDNPALSEQGTTSKTHTQIIKVMEDVSSYYKGPLAHIDLVPLHHNKFERPTQEISRDLIKPRIDYIINVLTPSIIICHGSVVRNQFFNLSATSYKRIDNNSILVGTVTGKHIIVVFIKHFYLGLDNRRIVRDKIIDLTGYGFNIPLINVSELHKPIDSTDSVQMLTLKDNDSSIMDLGEDYNELDSEINIRLQDFKNYKYTGFFYTSDQYECLRNGLYGNLKPVQISILIYNRFNIIISSTAIKDFISKYGYSNIICTKQLSNLKKVKSTNTRPVHQYDIAGDIEKFVKSYPDFQETLNILRESTRIKKELINKKSNNNQSFNL